MPYFKVGDIVECINHSCGAVNGQIYTVTNVIRDDAGSCESIEFALSFDERAARGLCDHPVSSGDFVLVDRPSRVKRNLPSWF